MDGLDWRLRRVAGYANSSWGSISRQAVRLKEGARSRVWSWTVQGMVPREGSPIVGHVACTRAGDVRAGRYRTAASASAGNLPESGLARFLPDEAQRSRRFWGQFERPLETSGA